MNTRRSQTLVVRMATKTVFALAVCAFVAGPVFAQPKDRQVSESVRSKSPTVAERVAHLERWSNALREEAGKPIPKNLSPTERAEAQRYVRWLRASAHRIDELAAQGRGALKAAPSPAALESVNEPFNMQYMDLQSQMHKENRTYTAIANLLKSKHDTTKNAISNIR